MGKRDGRGSVAQSLRSRESFLAAKSARNASLCSGLHLTAPIVALLCTHTHRHTHSLLLHCVCTRPAPTNHPPCSASAQASAALHCSLFKQVFMYIRLCSHFSPKGILSKKGNVQFVHDTALLSAENACRCASAGQLAPPPLD